jgi:hypothetical protein
MIAIVKRLIDKSNQLALPALRTGIALRGDKSNGKP